MLPMLALAGLALIAFAVLLLSVSGDNLVAGLAAMFAIILGYAFCIPIGAKYCSEKLTPWMQRIGGTTARMAAAGIGSSLSRTGVAIVALAIAVSATIGVNIMVNSFRDSVGTWLGSTLQSDIYVGVPRGSLDRDLLEDLVAAPGIVSYSTARRTWLETADGRTRVFAVQPALGQSPGMVLRSDDPESVWRQFTRADSVLVSDPYAYKNNVVAGDKVFLQTMSGRHGFSIAAVYQSYDSNDGVVMMKRETYDRFFDDPGIDSVGLYLDTGVDPENVMNELRKISAGRQALIMNSNARILEMSLRIFDRTFVITDVLYWLTVAIALVGILGAMLALQLERAREFGILRAVGMTPQQIGKLVTSQSALIGFLSGVAAIPLGVIMAVLLIEVINRRAFGWQMDISVTISGLTTALLLAVVAAVIAGIYPAVRAARGQPALAMREE
jgi:putative ABC transport system permease protein